MDRSFSILVTDDDPASRETFREIFEPVGFRTYLAESGEEAIEIIHQHDVHVALMDMHLPKLSGLETMAIVRQIKGMLPMILVSADQDEALMRRALSAQAFSVLAKPVSRNLVIYVVRRALEKFLLSPSTMRRTLVTLAIVLGPFASSFAHDIPDARVDRSIQATLEPSTLRVDYEVSLAELTLIQDLRQLGGEVSGGDRRGWFEQYGKVVGPLNAKGFLASVDGHELEWKSVGFDLSIEGHPRYTFHFETDVPPSGRLVLNDTNYLASEGTSRLALRPIEGVEISGDSLPADVSRIAIRPVWQLSNVEERRTRGLKVTYTSATNTQAPPPAEKPAELTRSADTPSGLSQLLDRSGGRAWSALLMAAFVLGAAHAIQPGHGKTLVAASSLGPGSGPFRGAWLGLATATAHMGSVALIAAALWATRSARPGEIHLTLARLAGFGIAAIGLWRLGRHLGGFGEHDHQESHDGHPPRGLIPLALAGGIVPCWDAVALVILSEALGRLPLGLTLLAAFSLGMASVLVLVGLAAGRFRASFERFDRNRRWERRFGVLGGLILSVIGLSMLRN